MSQQDYDRLAEQVVEAIRQQAAPRSPRATVNYLVESVSGNREVLRAVVSNLVVRGGLQLTSDLRVAVPDSQQAA